VGRHGNGVKLGPYYDPATMSSHGTKVGDQNAENQPAAESLPRAGVRSASSPPTPSATRVRYTRGTLAWLLVPLAGAAALAGYYLLRGARPATDSLAVLPFVLDRSEPATAVLAEGTRETLTTTLGRLPWLKVIAARTMSHFEGQQDPLQAGRQLNVRNIVTGRIVKHGDTLAVSVELITVADGTQLWSGSFIRKLSDLLGLQEELAGKIALSLRPQLRPGERDLLRRRATDNVVAYQLDAKGRYLLKTGAPQDLRDALTPLRQAIHEDPSYALAYADLAYGYVLLRAARVPAPPGLESAAAARAAAERAMAIDPELAEAYAALGLIQRIFDEDVAAAERSLRKAAELEPSLAEAHWWHAETLVELDRSHEAEAAIRRAVELDPLSLSDDAARPLPANPRFVAFVRRIGRSR